MGYCVEKCTAASSFTIHIHIHIHIHVIQSTLVLTEATMSYYSHLRQRLQAAACSLSRRRCRILIPTSLQQRHAPLQFIININNSNSSQHRSYFTNTDQLKNTDPYATLGLSWGASLTEIKEAYLRHAKQFHPDVVNNSSTIEDRAVAMDRFKRIKHAYEILTNSSKGGENNSETEWSFGIWRTSDILAQNRTDVAGVKRKRPMKPAESLTSRWGMGQIGHPDGRGVTTSQRGEYLSDGGRRQGTTSSSTVGHGRSKWVEKREYKPWVPK